MRFIIRDSQGIRESRLHPLSKALLEFIGGQSAESTVERVMGWNAVRQLKECTKPVFFFFTKLLHIFPRVSVSNNRTDSNDKDIDEIMKTRFGASGVFKLEEERDQGSWFKAHKSGYCTTNRQSTGA